MFHVAHHDPDLAYEIRRAREICGKSALRQLWEMARLAAPPTLHAPWTYHRYRLWDDALTWEQKQEFIGNNAVDWYIHRVCDMRDAPQLRDKAEAYRILGAAGVPVPRRLAAFHPSGEVAGESAFSSTAEMAAFLRDGMPYPFFYKPVSSHQSVGAGLATRYDRAADRIELFGEEPEPVDKFVLRFDEFRATAKGNAILDPEAGYLFQELVKPHPEIAERCGDVLAGLRVYVLIDESGPKIFRSPLKIPAPGVPADNFYRPGALLADVDVETGRLGRVVRGVGADQEILDSNPYTGARLTGWRLPLYDRMREMVLEGAMVFPRIRFQGWDVGIGPDGPVTIELNVGSSFRLAQFASGRGIGTPGFREALRRAEALNAGRPRPPAISWDRADSMWRLKGLVTLARTALGMRPR